MCREFLAVCDGHFICSSNNLLSRHDIPISFCSNDHHVLRQKLLPPVFHRLLLSSNYFLWHLLKEIGFIRNLTILIIEFLYLALVLLVTFIVNANYYSYIIHVL